jgi:hypothetical protein
MARASFHVATVKDILLVPGNKVWTIGLRLMADGNEKKSTNRFQFSSEEVMTEMGCGAFFKRLLSFGCFPEIISSASLRISIIASQNLDAIYQQLKVFLQLAISPVKFFQGF